jgi:uncharacterized protein (TIGR02598 family)
MRTSRRADPGGFTLVETTIATALAALFLSSLFTMNVASMDTIRCAKEAVSASQTLQQRIESMRIANWQEITDADWKLHNRQLVRRHSLANCSRAVTV